MSPPADWIYQCRTPQAAPPSVAASSTGTGSVATRDTTLMPDSQSTAGDYMLYMCPGHEMMEQRPRDDVIYQQHYRQPQTVDPAGDTHTRACMDSYGDVCSGCDCMESSDLVACTQQRPTSMAASEVQSDVTTLDITANNRINTNNEEFMNIPPIK